MYAVCHHSTTRMRASTGVRTTVTKGGHRCPQVSKQTRVRSLSLRLLAHASSLFLCSHHHKHETDGKHGEEHNANAQHCRSPAGPLHLGPAPSCGCMRDFSHRCARGLAWVVRMFKDMSAVVRAEAGVCSAKFGEQDVDLAKLSPVWAPAARRREAASVRPVLSRTPRPAPLRSVPSCLFGTLSVQALTPPSGCPVASSQRGKKKKVVQARLPFAGQHQDIRTRCGQAPGDAMGNAQSARRPKPAAPRQNMQPSAAIVARSFPSDESGQGPKVRSPFSGLMIAATPSRLVRSFLGSLHCPNPFLLHVLVRWTLIIAGADALAHQHADTSKQCPATEASLTGWH